MYFAVSVGMLGYTRIQSVVCYNSETRAFDELTPAIARRAIESKQLKGVLWQANGGEDENGGMFVPDTEGFNKHNIMVKTAACKFRPLLRDLPGLPVNSMYNVVRVLYTDYRGTLYEIVSNRYDRIKITEEHLRKLDAISPVAGVWITENEIKIADGIKIEDRTGRGLAEEAPVTEPVEVKDIVEEAATEEVGVVEEVVAEVTEVKEEVVTETTVEAENITMEAVFGDVSEVQITEEQKADSFNAESGIGENVEVQEDKEKVQKNSKKKKKK